MLVFVFHSGLRAEEGVQLIESEGGVGEALTFSFLDEADEGGVDEQGSHFILEGVFADIGEVESEDFDEFQLVFGLELLHQGHDQVFELPHHVAAYFLLALENGDKVVKVLVDPDGEASFLVYFEIILLLAVGLFKHWAQVDFLRELFFKLQVSHLVIDRHLPRKDVIVIHIVNVEVFLPLVREDGVQLEEVLSPLGGRREPLPAPTHQSHHLQVVYYNQSPLRPASITTNLNTSRPPPILTPPLLSLIIRQNHMDQEEIRQVLRRKDGGKIDSYIQQKVQKKEEEIDLMNLMKTWTHSLLYHKNIYPPDAFAERQLLGQKVFVATAESLKDYLDDFFDKLQPHIAHLNHLQILLTTSQGNPVQTHTLHIQDFAPGNLSQAEKDCHLSKANKTQKEIEFKSFIYDLQHCFSSGFVRGEQEVTFRLRVGYRMEASNENESNSLVQDWVKRQNISEQKRRTVIMASLKSHSLNLIHEVEL